MDGLSPPHLSHAVPQVTNIQTSSENPPGWNAAMGAARKRTGQQPDLVLDPFSPLTLQNQEQLL